MIISDLPRIGERIVVRTMPYELKGFFGLRNFILESTDGRRMAWANSVWTNINTRTGMPERLTEADTSGYVLDEKLDMPYAPRKIALGSPWEMREPFTIMRHLLDTHHHVNNCQYVRMAEDYLPAGRQVRQLRVEYKKQAVLGDVLYPMVCDRGDMYQVVFSRVEDIEKPDPYVTVEYS